MKTEAKLIISSAIGVILFSIFSGAAFKTSISTYNSSARVVDQSNQCTMEAKVCPDGSFVGRAGSKCEFTSCPDVTTLPIYEIQ